MNRPRIFQQQPKMVISVRGRIVFAREDKEITELFQRRTLFFKTRDKLNGIIEITVELISFNNSFAKIVQDFKKTYKN